MNRRTCCTSIGAAAVVILLAVTQATLSAAALHTMQLPGATFSYATAISADGLTIAGTSELLTGNMGWRWTAAGGITPLGVIPNSGGVAAYDPTGVSASGSVIVGAGYRWTSAAGLTAFNVFNDPGGLSGDGNVAVGTVYHSPLGQEAARWTSASGTQLLGGFPGGPLNSLAHDVSADGSIVVGHAALDPWQSAPFRWTQQSGLVNLGLLPGAREGSAYRISGDGSTIVGGNLYLNDDDNRFFGQPFRWTQQAGLVPLIPYSPLNPEMTIADISADGNVIIGRSVPLAAPAFHFHWTPLTGVRNMGDVFMEHGVDLTGYLLNELNAVSADGRTFAGRLRTPMGEQVAFVATIPEPAAALIATPAAMALLATRRRRQ